jgi:hypothetical protein
MRPPDCRLDGHDERPRPEECDGCKAVYEWEYAEYLKEWEAHRATIHCPSCMVEADASKGYGCLFHADHQHRDCRIHHMRRMLEHLEGTR